MSTVVIVRFYWPDSFDAEFAKQETEDRLSKQFNLEMFEVEDVETEAP